MPIFFGIQCRFSLRSLNDAPFCVRFAVLVEYGGPMPEATDF